MTPYEVLRTYLHLSPTSSSEGQAPLLHWGYHKHNTVTGPAPVATQILHAAGIAFASKLRKADVVTVAYCGDSATNEADFLEGIRFAVQHRLAVVIICEQDCPNKRGAPSSTGQITSIELPEGIAHQQVNGTDIFEVYEAMSTAMAHARSGQGPILLEMHVTRTTPFAATEEEGGIDPLLLCEEYMQKHGVWDKGWAEELRTRLATEVSSALQDVLREAYPEKPIQNKPNEKKHDMI
jgi:2-oxoisovalerate dehydrogenase E1 component alpha subunit